MTKTIWETRSCPYDTRETGMRVREVCNELGADGWEPFQVEPNKRGETGYIWFKRPKSEEAK